MEGKEIKKATLKINDVIDGLNVRGKDAVSRNIIGESGLKGENGQDGSNGTEGKPGTLGIATNMSNTQEEVHEIHLNPSGEEMDFNIEKLIEKLFSNKE